MGTPLTREEEQDLKSQLLYQYTDFLNKIIDDTSEFCGQQIAIPYIYFAKEGKLVNKTEGATQYAITVPLFTMADLNLFIAKTGMTMEKSITIPRMFKNQSKEDVSTTTLFLEQCEKRYFTLSVRIVPLGDAISHQTLLLFDKDQKRCIVVEPETYVSNISRLYSNLLQRLELNEYTLIEPAEQCVQAVADDKNCMYWSLYLLTRYIREGASNIDEISKKTLAENQTPEALKVVINNFKRELYRGTLPPVQVPSQGAPVVPGGKKTENMSSKVGRNQWVTSTGSRSHKRTRRLRRRHPQKNRSKSSKNARHTRKRV